MSAPLAVPPASVPKPDSSDLQVPSTPPPKPKKPYKELNLEEKVTLIKMAQDNPRMSQAELAKIFGIAKSNVCRILKRRYEYLSVYECASFSGERKRKLRDSDTKELNMLVAWWVRSRFQKGDSVTGPLVQEKAREFAQLLNVQNFVASNGWLQSFQKSYFNTLTMQPGPQSESNGGAPQKFAQPTSQEAESSKTSSGTGGNETLRAHMYKYHQISRMFMCRCCNWAFPDKTSLHIHMQSMATTGQPGNMASIIARGGPGGVGAGPLSLDSTPRQSIEDGSEPPTPTLDHKELLQRERDEGNGSGSPEPGLGIDHWFHNVPKVDASGVGSLGGTLCLTEDDDENESSTVEERRESDGNNNRYSLDKMEAEGMEGVEEEEEGKPATSPKSDQELIIDEQEQGGLEGLATLIAKRKASTASLSSVFQTNAALPIPAFLQRSVSMTQEAEKTQVNSPSESSTSPVRDGEAPDSGSEGSSKGPCFSCQVQKGRLVLSENRSRFLEGKVRSLENKITRLESQIGSMDSNVRRYEAEGGTLRAQSESLQGKLMQCQERALAFLQKGMGDPAMTQKFLAEILQTTYLGAH